MGKKMKLMKLMKKSQKSDKEVLMIVVLIRIPYVSMTASYRAVIKFLYPSNRLFASDSPSS
ncbi:hypothetical protein AGABI2DRAFT_132592, partial [Agaricus bisporus var. bisporus H97]|uniref:hypothetical protein n=1 Tax=Agaricus bisporus var. bisporus (strain H97 / ATCC MYA-4626 / FGSC 10389) TaxID=936046 RepID=UPI00029F6BD5